jgi:hypothetical protein
VVVALGGTVLEPLYLSLIPDEVVQAFRVVDTTGPEGTPKIC